MAEASIQFLLDNLQSLLQEEVGLITGVKQEVSKLSSTYSAIKAKLEDAEYQQLESESIRDWLCKLNDLNYEIEDILDECTTEVSVSKLEHQSSKLSRYSLKKILKKILSRHKMGRRIKQVNGKLDTISMEREKLDLREMGIERKSNYAATRETASSLNESEHIYGRDKEKEEIVDILVKGDCDEGQLSVLPVLGLGGLGKTTLTRLVFNDKKVDDHFDMKIWVCVSDDFDVKTLVKAMIESATDEGSCSDLTNLDALQRRLRELLNQKRYLIVLDDVWNDDQEKWGLLRNAVACGSKGATIVVTTRLKIVADIMGTLPAHHIAGLSEENCWLLFKERAFGQEKEERVNLEGIGRQIVEKCCGVPLAAKALGGLVRFKRTEKEWLHVLNSEIWNLSQDYLLLPALQVSYHHLPLELRRCFAYCAVFPKDTRIYKDEVIFLWMSHGYISSDGSLEEEDIGNAIWNELVLRSLFQDVKEVVVGRTVRTAFTMHDLVHDLAQSVMENKVSGTQARLNDKAASKDFRIREVNLKNCLVAFPCRIQPKIDLSFSLTNLNRLRVLHASDTSIGTIPSTIGNLKHLRYLNLYSSEIRTLPDAICSLWNLKILNLNECYFLVELPKQMRILRNLRHLLLEECISLDEMPSKMGELGSLKTLSLFVVGVGKGKGLGDLQFLNIGGKLRIRHLERVKNLMDANMANLLMKENLRELRLEWSDDKISENMDEDVLKALEPHPNIKIMTISGFRGSYFPRWRTNSSLVNLVEFYLEDCPNCCSLARLGDLPHLKTMKLRCVGVEYIVDEDEVSSTRIKFPSLEQLFLFSLEHLKGFSKGNDIESFPRLQNLNIRECSSLPEDIGYLKSLTSLYLSNLPKMVSLPEALKHLSSPYSLSLFRLPELITIATCLTSCTSLISLEIYDCPKLTSLPDSIKETKNLKTLWIKICPELKKRCDKEKGQDWHKIAHIPDVKFGW